MSFTDIFMLAFLQGLTEFLPVSSSAHLILFSQLRGLPDQGIGFDIAVHLGSLTAVIYYFRNDLRQMLAGCFNSLQTKRLNTEVDLTLKLLMATLPIVIVGLIARDTIESELRTIGVIAATTIGFGLLLAVADRQSGQKNEYQLSSMSALIIGFAQVLALVPGTSRSGIVITAALFLGLTRKGSARFAFLLAIPAIGGASFIQLTELIVYQRYDYLIEAGIGFTISALISLITIRLFLGLVERLGMMPFVVYRCLLGAGLLLLL